MGSCNSPGASDALLLKDEATVDGVLVKAGRVIPDALGALNADKLVVEVRWIARGRRMGVMGSS